MRRATRWLLLLGAVAISANVARAQTPATAPSSTAGHPGVDVYSTLYPRPPSSTVTQPTANLPLQPGNFVPYPPAGYAANNVIWYPALTAATFFDDNVFARHSNRQSDWAAVLRPELAWRTSNWANMEAVGAAYAEQRWYHRFNSEDQFNTGAVVGATVRPGENTELVTRAQVLHAHEDRGTSESINAPTFTKPIAYTQAEAAGAINQRYNRWWTSIGAGVVAVEYDDGTVGAGIPGVAEGTIVSQGYRNGIIANVPARVGYVVAPLTSVFVEVAGNRRNFHVDQFDSRGYRVVGGMLFEPGPGSRVKGEFFAGYMNQNYAGPGFDTVSTWTIGSALAFLVTPTVTATLETRRNAAEASLSGGEFATVPGDGVSVIETVAAGRVDWLVAPKTVLGAGVAYLQDDFLSANRTDRSWSPLASAKYFVNPYLTLGFDYRYLNFDSSGLLVPSYSRNVFLFSANMRR